MPELVVLVPVELHTEDRKCGCSLSSIARMLNEWDAGWQHHLNRLHVGDSVMSSAMHSEILDRTFSLLQAVAAINERAYKFNNATSTIAHGCNDALPECTPKFNWEI